MDGSSHSNHLALHCLALFLANSDATRPHWFMPYFMTAALSVSSSLFFQMPPFITTRTILVTEFDERLTD